MTSNYEFLAVLHDQLQPRGYLEIGVRHGDSLRLANCRSIGVDPNPAMRPGEFGNYRVYDLTSDQFFDNYADEVLHEFPVDLVYIDGMHLYEYALRDFINVARYANERTVIVFDDTHPYNRAIATREQPPGDWTGDVWKTMELIELCMDYGSMKSAQVDVSPTGAFVVWDLKPEFDVQRRFAPFFVTNDFGQEMPVPADIVDRSNTIPPDEAINQILETLT